MPTRRAGAANRSGSARAPPAPAPPLREPLPGLAGDADHGAVVAAARRAEQRRRDAEPAVEQVRRAPDLRLDAAGGQIDELRLVRMLPRVRSDPHAPVLDAPPHPGGGPP